MYIYLIFILIVEFLFGYLHYNAVQQAIEKGMDLDPVAATILPILWGVVAALIPSVIYYFYFLFSQIKDKVVDRTDIVNEAKEVAQKFKSRGITFFNSVTLITVCVAILFICAETFFFYKMFESSNMLFGGEEGIDSGALITGLSFALGHHLVAIVFMFIAFLLTQKAVFSFMNSRLR